VSVCRYLSIMLIHHTKNTSINAEAFNALSGRYPDNEAGRAARATMALVNRNDPVAKELIFGLSTSPEGRLAICQEIRSLTQEGWYRSLTDFYRHVPTGGFHGYETEIHPLITLADNGMRKFGVADVAEQFRSVLATSHPEFLQFLSEEENSLSAADPKDRIVHALRMYHGTPQFESILSTIPPSIVTEGFNDYLKRQRLPWAAELLDFCYSSGPHRTNLLAVDAVKRLAQNMREQAAIVSLRFLAEVVRERHEYRQEFCKALEIQER